MEFIVNIVLGHSFWLYFFIGVVWFVCALLGDFIVNGEYEAPTAIWFCAEAAPFIGLATYWVYRVWTFLVPKYIATTAAITVIVVVVIVVAIISLLGWCMDRFFGW